MRLFNDLRKEGAMEEQGAGKPVVDSKVGVTANGNDVKVDTTVSLDGNKGKFFSSGKQENKNSGNIAHTSSNSNNSNTGSNQTNITCRIL